MAAVKCAAAPKAGVAAKLTDFLPPPGAPVERPVFASEFPDAAGAAAGVPNKLSAKGGLLRDLPAEACISKITEEKQRMVDIQLTWKLVYNICDDQPCSASSAVATNVLHKKAMHSMACDPHFACATLLGSDRKSLVPRKHTILQYVLKVVQQFVSIADIVFHTIQPQLVTAIGCLLLHPPAVQQHELVPCYLT